MELMIKKITTNHRELVRNWARLREKLLYGEADQLVIPENGHAYIISIKKPKHRPGDIHPLLEKLNKHPLKGFKFIRPDGSLKSLALMKKLWKTP